MTRDRADVPADDVARLYQAGWTVTRIAARYGAAASTVLRRLDDAGVARRPRSIRVWFPVDEAARRVQQEGTSLAQLARDYEVGVDAVRGQLAARGIHAPPCTGPRVLRGVPAAEIVDLYATGLTMTAIAGRYGVSPDTIRARLLAAGVTPRRVPEFEVYRAAQRAIGRASERELGEHGLRHGPDGLYATPRFEIYWTPKPAPPADTTVVERIAMWQIWATLRPLHKMAFLALAAHNDYTKAAEAVGYPYSTFAYLISQARAEFLALWHEGQQPARPWATDRHGNGDIEQRVQRTIAARRGKSRS